jgi:hypothetical protein
MWASPFERALRSIVEQRIDRGGGDIRIASQVIRGVEQRMRVAAFGRSREDEMR